MSAINFTLKEFLEIFHNTKWGKGEMLEGHPNRNRVWQFTRNRKDAHSVS